MTKACTGPARPYAENRFREEGAKARRGTPNPYKAGSAAATWWQRGYDSDPMRDLRARLKSTGLF